MANQLKMAMIGSILTLRRQGLSGRRIADLLGVNRETVSRYLRLARTTTGRTEAETQPPEAGAALHPPGLEASNPAMAPSGRTLKNRGIRLCRSCRRCGPGPRAAANPTARSSPRSWRPVHQGATTKVR